MTQAQYDLSHLPCLPPTSPPPPPPCPPAGAHSAVVCNHHGLGGAGATDLASAVVEACASPADFKFLYDVNLSIKVGGLKLCLKQTPASG